VVCVVGTPLDFRLSFGSFGGAQVIHVVDSTAKRATHATTAVSIEGDLATCLHLLVEGLEGSFTGSRATERREWVSSLRDRETSARQVEKPLLESSSNPIHPMRIFGELAKAVDRDAIVIGDGGDFVSFAGKLVESYNPGCWLDPGPYGCLGTGLGYIAGARIVHPDRQIVALMGDGAFGFSAMDVDTLVRNQLPAVIIVGNNGIWGLEKHPMKAIYGYDVAADLQEGCRYDQVVSALGGAGETVDDPDEIGPAIKRALDSGMPYLVNIITDPEAVYPRTSNLA